MDDLVETYKRAHPDLYERQWHLHGRSFDGQVDPRASLRCEEAWALAGAGSPDIVIAFADDGCQVDHPVFGGPEKFAGAVFRSEGAWRFVRDFQIFRDKIRAEGLTHGTSMAALIAATGRDGTIGVAPGCRLLPIRMPMRGAHVVAETSDILAVLDLISDHADVAILSWSRVPLLIPPRQLITRLRDVAERGGRHCRGVLFVMPAGNSNCPIAWESSRPVPYGLNALRRDGMPTILTSRTFRNLLTALPSVLHISAISSLARRAFYSCYGPGVDLCAPSSNSRVFTGDVVCGHGRGLTTSYGPNGEITDAFKGTSGAAALVAGVAALTLSARPGISAGELGNVLMQSASKDLDGRETIGDIPNRCEWEVSPVAPFEKGDFNLAGWSPWFGHGKVDAYAAVKLAQVLNA